ncbi:helix-turn-helix domain-containing protein [Flexivirga caeni]|uniref:XRE family transcriptional regulator n=1 Tax=Flexivirga caeni TaxID=2294115 RepID=A0A3M9LWU4_9MICO|nr:helix-turn-helix transcriptional regulator [Flexivirga caeni]RNI17053.1 XRE family transcriptional regulator [Flexivirga caeni]
MARAKDPPEGWDERARQIGIRLQRARHALDLSQEEVAHRVGISSYTYQKFEKGESKPGTPMNPRLTTLLAVCGVLGMSLDELVGR